MLQRSYAVKLEEKKLVNFLFPVIPGGLGIPPIRHSHRDAGGDLEGDQEALLRSLVQSGPELHRRGLGHCEGGLKAEGDDESRLL